MSAAPRQPVDPAEAVALVAAERPPLDAGPLFSGRICQGGKPPEEVPRAHPALARILELGLALQGRQVKCRDGEARSARRAGAGGDPRKESPESLHLAGFGEGLHSVGEEDAPFPLVLDEELREGDPFGAERHLGLAAQEVDPRGEAEMEFGPVRGDLVAR